MPSSGFAGTVPGTRGLANGLIPSSGPLLRKAFSAPDPDFYIFEDFRYGFSMQEGAGGYGNTVDPINAAPWRLFPVDGGGDNAHTCWLFDNISTAEMRTLTNDADNDENAIQYAYEPLTGTGRWAAEAKLKVDDASLSAMFFGFHNFKAAGTIAQTAALGGVVSGFHVANGASSVAIVATSDNGTNTSTDLSGTTGGSLVDDTYVTLSLYHDNLDGTKFYVDGKLAATHTPSQATLAGLFAAPTISIANASAAARTMSVEHMAFWVEG